MLDARLDLERPHRREAPPARLEDPLKLVAHGAEEVRGALRIVSGRVRRAAVPLEPGGERCTHEDRLTKGDPAQGRGVEARERVKGIALDLRARDGRIDES